ncbi:MAG: hypothetical protein HY650_11790 [Acidobacteria bacterium]|nr:hypothetical protein [Acidobacteriota bacterium]
MKRLRNIAKLVILALFIPTAVFMAAQSQSSQRLEFRAGDTVPGFVLQTPSGGIADVRAAGTYDKGTGNWTLVLTRLLVTGHPDEDVQFDRLASGQTYLFSVACLDNAVGEREHMEPQDHSAYILGIEGTEADLIAKRETPASPSQFTGPAWVTLGGEKNGVIVPPITLKAAYDDKNIYVLATWRDMTGTESIHKQRWVYDGLFWVQTTSKVNDEDRLAIWWDINAQDFVKEGCAALCHVDDPEDQRMRTRNPDGRADLWHWKAARSNPMGLADDQKAAPRRGDDRGVGIAVKNELKGDPAFMADNDPGANADFLILLPKGAKSAVTFRGQ